MHVTHHTDFNTLAPWSHSWNELARGVPFRSWQWLETWWRHYGCQPSGEANSNYELCVLAVWKDDGDLAGIAPWYRLHGRSGARSIRFLGDGEVCSDYLSILCKAADEEAVAQSLTEWLAAASSDENKRWDRLEIAGVDAADNAVNRLLEKLRASGNQLHHCLPPTSWRINLPATWDEYLMRLSKPHRNRLRKAHKNYFDNGRVEVQLAATPAELQTNFDTLIQLHQGRWQGRGESGCFASSQFESFHREVSARLFEIGAATVTRVFLDGTPLAADYQLNGDGISYAYQCGIDTTRLQCKPGHLANMAALRRAIAEGRRGYDFLRGDEPYKAHWRAEPRPMLWVRVVPDRPGPRLRHNAWLAARGLKHWIKRGVGLVQKPARQQVVANHGED